MSNPGKFEACQNQELGEYLHQLSLDGLDNELGDVSDFGFYGLLLNVDGIGKNKSYIINEDNDGFFTYETYDTEKDAMAIWGNLEAEYQHFMDNQADY